MVTAPTGTVTFKDGAVMLGTLAVTCLGIFGPFMTWKWPLVNWFEFSDHFDRQVLARKRAIHTTYVS